MMRCRGGIDDSTAQIANIDGSGVDAGKDESGSSELAAAAASVAKMEAAGTLDGDDVTGDKGDESRTTHRHASGTSELAAAAASVAEMEAAGTLCGNEYSDSDDERVAERAHSFRKRRLTYTRHHIVSDSAAAAVAQLMAEGENYSSGDEGKAGDKGGEVSGERSPAASASKVDEDDSAASKTGTVSGTAQVGGKKRGAPSSPGEDATAAEEAKQPSKKIKSDTDTSRPGPPRKAHLPSRILHAGEIVRRISSTSVDAQPRRRSQRRLGEGGAGVGSKWRQRFSFCGSTPDNLLPFPRDVVGTYSCHGIEPVYDSDYDDDEDDGDEGKNEGESGKTTASKAKINQDRGGIAFPYGDSPRQALFSAYDGHGDGGELVSQYSLHEVQRLLQAHPSFGNDIAEAFRDTFVRVDRGLLDEPEIQPMYCGTTACVVLLRNNKLHVSNLGDSRAVLARRTAAKEEKVEKGEGTLVSSNGKSSLTAIDLSTDQNPDSPGEMERILEAGGFVSPPPEPGLSARVWLDDRFTQIGLAMARSIGDHAVKGVGVIAEPVVQTHELTDEDEFMIVATDGVWEFISSEEAVRIVETHLEKGDGAAAACEALIKEASKKWHEFEGDYRDDITALVVRLKMLWGD